MKDSFKKVTTLDYIIIGLIQDKPLTGYKIRKTFEDTALGNFGGSPGSIYPALKRLISNHLIEKETISSGLKSHFKITKTGIRLLKLWLEELPEDEEVRKGIDLLVLKFAFMDPLLNKKQKLEYLFVLKIKLDNYLKELEAYFHEEKASMPLSGQLAFQHGLLSYNSTLDWCRLAIKTLG